LNFTDYKFTEYMALYAAALSTFVFVWNVLRSRPKFRVRLTFGMEKKADGDAQMGVYVLVENTSGQAVHLSNLSVLSRYKKSTAPEILSYMLKYRRVPYFTDWTFSSLSSEGIADGLPLSIEPYKSHKVFIPQQALEEILRGTKQRQIRIAVYDQLDNITYSRAKLIDWYDSKIGIG